MNNRPLNYNVGKCPYIAVPESLIERYGFAGSFVWNRIIIEYLPVGASDLG